MARMAAAVYGLDDRLDFVSGHELDEASAQPIPAEMLGRHPSTANTNSSTPPQKRRQTLREWRAVLDGHGIVPVGKVPADWSRI